MSKYVSETAAAKRLKAYVVMKGRRHVATVQAHYSDSRCLVNVRQDDDAAARSALKNHSFLNRHAMDYEDARRLIFQRAAASGYGYDKFAAALAGMWIDGHRMSDHQEHGKIPPKGADVFPADYIPPKGYKLANWCPEKAGWKNCYRLGGLRYLEDIGYTVVRAI